MFCVSMENYLTLDNVDVQPEDYSNSFLCCICLDLLYKPVVLACGHISCFWCIHRSMSSRRESHCPICRHTYNHFPNICWMLHLLLLKIYPITYKIREQQILEEEKKIGIFSSQFENHGCELLVYTKVDHLEDSTNSSTAVSVSASKVESLQYMEQLESVSLILNNGTPISKQTSVRTVAAMKKKFPENKLNNCKQIPIADVQCTACKQLLFNPVVLNCGHVYCETCIIKPTNEQLMCQVCGCLNPGGLPKVCLELNQFLDEQFCKEYATRRDVVELTKTLMKDESTTMCCMEAGKLWSLVNTGEDITWWADPHPTVHVKFGCDSCGMFPIIGERYKCIDCVEAAGFDLCGHCYHTRSSIPGRFNQLHTPEHRLELVKPKNIHDMMVRLVGAQLEDGSTAQVMGDNVLVNQS